MFDPRAQLKCIETLIEVKGIVDPADHAAINRTICNRCYYAAYGSIRKTFEIKEPELFGQAGMHKRLVQIMTAVSNDPHINGIGARLNSLKCQREWSDYEYSPVDCSEEQLELNKRNAARVIDKFDKLSGNQIDRLVMAMKSVR
tara:strand:+ start:1051 stop:1482 length:432 start_codon:yes stop_codon:yes gene_type:complete